MSRYSITRNGLTYFWPCSLLSVCTMVRIARKGVGTALTAEARAHGVTEVCFFDKRRSVLSLLVAADEKKV